LAVVFAVDLASATDIRTFLCLRPLDRSPEDRIGI
jgi:hypothetical protein